MSFEEFLIDYHADRYVGTDDAMVEHFDDWLEFLDHDEWMELAEA